MFSFSSEITLGHCTFIYPLFSLYVIFHTKKVREYISYNSSRAAGILPFLQMGKQRHRSYMISLNRVSTSNCAGFSLYKELSREVNRAEIQPMPDNQAVHGPSYLGEGVPFSVF